MSGRVTEEQHASVPLPALQASFKQAEIQPRGNPPPSDGNTTENLEAGMLENTLIPAAKEKEAMSVFGLLKVVSYSIDYYYYADQGADSQSIHRQILKRSGDFSTRDRRDRRSVTLPKIEGYLSSLLIHTDRTSTCEGRQASLYPLAWRLDSQ